MEELQNLMFAIKGNDFKFEFDYDDGFNPNFEQIACDVYGITLKDIRSKTKKQVIIKARYMIYAYLNESTNKLPLYKIGEPYDNDHTTVSRAIESHKRILLSKNKEYSLKWIDFKTRIKADKY